VSHFDKAYFDRLESRRADQATLCQQERVAGRGHSWQVTILLIAALFLIFIGIGALPTVLGSMRLL